MYITRIFNAIIIFLNWGSYVFPVCLPDLKHFLKIVFFHKKINNLEHKKGLKSCKLRNYNLKIVPKFVNMKVLKLKYHKMTKKRSQNTIMQEALRRYRLKIIRKLKTILLV